jgi:hypothetical protein
VRFDSWQNIRSQLVSNVLKFASASSPDFHIASTIERGQKKLWLLPLVIGIGVPAIGARALSHSKQLQRKGYGGTALWRSLARTGCGSIEIGAEAVTCPQLRKN